MTIKCLKIKLIISILVFFPKNLYAISGNEINIYIKKWFASEGIKSNPQFSPNKKFPDCNNIVYEKYKNSLKLVKVTCEGKNSWKIFVKTNSNTLKEKRIEESKSKKILVLNKSIEKGNYLKKNDLVYVDSPKKNVFYTNKEELIGRKVRQNLRKGQYVQPRHLFGKYSVNEGDPVVIVSKFKNTEVSTGGIVLKSGNVGDILEVKNTRSGKVIKGILNKNRKINVFF